MDSAKTILVMRFSARPVGLVMQDSVWMPALGKHALTVSFVKVGSACKKTVTQKDAPKDKSVEMRLVSPIPAKKSRAPKKSFVVVVSA